ncbi:hypothetical protein EDD85DRAFT_978669 [Armillaria nabsnona]|nr:hypothetical protein EDD85DRAFT_978669 [Armillaria nabsnona]
MLAVTFSAALTINPIERHGSNELVKREQLSDGTHGLEGGKINQGLSWQSSGILLVDKCGKGITISDCYSLELSGDPSKNLQDREFDSPRQRIEFWTPGAADGTTQKFKWRFSLSPQTKTTKNFFHLMQDYKRDCDVTDCPSIPLDRFTDRTTVYFVTFGPKGSIEYVIKDAADESVALLSYRVKGAMGSDSSSIKFGTYRLAVDGMTKSLAYAGDFVDESDS